MTSSASHDFYPGQRLSYAGALCTVRYFGPLHGTQGPWLGVEWDDPSRGKHFGQHQGETIFQCLSKSQTAASFIRPSRRPDPQRTVLEALIHKYGTAGTDSNSIQISGKVVEEVGFEKIQKQISVFNELRIVLLDELNVSGLTIPDSTSTDLATAQDQLSKTCPKIIEIDLGWNLIETWTQIAEVCTSLKKLRILKTSGLRLRSFTTNEASVSSNPFQNIEELHLNECLLKPKEVLEILSSSPENLFPSLKLLSLSHNELDAFNLDTPTVITSIHTLVLENNLFTSLDVCSDIIAVFPNITNLSLQGNQISKLGTKTSASPGQSVVFEKIETLNLAGNTITDFSFIDLLPEIFPSLTSLRISKNPLYDQSADAQSQPASSVPTDTLFFLTLARIPNLRSLNYTSITTRDREEGEIYYLSVAEKEIQPTLESQPIDPASLDKIITLFHAKYPRYEALCTKYDRDSIFEKLRNQTNLASTSTNETPAYAPGTLGARLINATFYIPDKTPTASLQRAIPNSTTVYQLKAVLARHFSLPPLQFRVVYESAEFEIARTAPTQAYGDTASWDEWGEWDADGEDDNAQDETGSRRDDISDETWVDGFLLRDGQRWKKREIEVRDGMRAWGDYLEDGVREVTARVEPFSK